MKSILLLLFVSIPLLAREEFSTIKKSLEIIEKGNFPGMEKNLCPEDSIETVKKCQDLSSEDVISGCLAKAPANQEMIVSPTQEFGICEEWGIGPFKKKSRYKKKSESYKLAIKNSKVYLSQRVEFDSRKVGIPASEFHLAFLEIVAEAKRFYARQGIQYELEWRDKAEGKNNKFEDHPKWKPLELRFDKKVGLSSTHTIKFGEFLKNGTLLTEDDPRVEGKKTVHGRLAKTVVHELIHEMGIPDDYVPPEDLPVECRHHYTRRNLTRTQFSACEDPLTQGQFCDNIMLNAQVIEKSRLPSDYLARIVSPLCENVCDSSEKELLSKKEAQLFLDDYSKNQNSAKKKIAYEKNKLIASIDHDVKQARAMGFNEWAENVTNASSDLKKNKSSLIDIGLDEKGQTVNWNKLISPIHYFYVTMPAELRVKIRP